MAEYGRIHTDGSRSGGQPVVDNAMLDALQKDAGLPHLPTQETYQFRMAVSGEGPLAYQWSDKPHRLLYDACSIIEREAALRTYSNVVAAGSDRIGGAGVVPHGVVGVAAQREITQADIDAAESIFWVETIIDDHEAVAKAFARHHQHGYDQGYYDGQRDRPPTQSDALRVKLLEDALLAVVEATRAYLPPDGIDAKECLSRILGATDNPTINPIIFEIEGRPAQEQAND